MIATKEKFRQKVIQSILAKYPEWQVEPKDEFAISVKVSGMPGCINLDNIYHQVQLKRVPKQDLIQDFLAEFAKAIKNTENSLNNFDAIRHKIFLVVRPTDFYGDEIADNHDGQLAFILPVLPDLALYWAVDTGKSYYYISNSLFSSWKVRSDEVMWWACKNTCEAEGGANIRGIGDDGLLIFATRKMGTISPLLFKPRYLQMLIHSTRPDWPEQPYLVCIPVPDQIIIAREGHDKIVKEFSLIAQERYGKALSDTYSPKISLLRKLYINLVKRNL